MTKYVIFKPTQEDFDRLGPSAPSVKSLKAHNSWEGTFVIDGQVSWAGSGIHDGAPATAYWSIEHDRWVSTLSENPHGIDIPAVIDSTAKMWATNNMDMDIVDFLNHVLNNKEE